MDWFSTVSRGHLPNVDSRQANHKIFHPLPGVREQFASCKHPLSIDFYLSSADLIDLAWNLPLGSAQMVKAEPEAAHEHWSVFQHGRVCTDKQSGWLYLLIVFSIRSAFLTDHYHLVRRMVSERKLTLEQRVHAMKALDSGWSCRDFMLKFGCWKSQISRIKSPKVIFTAKFTYVHVYVHTFKVLLN